MATDHVIESFRNGLWPGYKTGDGVEPALRAQFHPLEEALGAMGVAVWPMIELEADDALASAARIACEDERVEKVLVWTPDKDIAQCVRGSRVMQVDRKAKVIRDAEGVRTKFGVVPSLIPDFLALVGDAADGYPGIAGIAGIGQVTAAQLLNRHGSIEAFPAHTLREQRATALLFKKDDLPYCHCEMLVDRTYPWPGSDRTTTRADTQLVVLFAPSGLATKVRVRPGYATRG